MLSEPQILTWAEAKLEAGCGLAAVGLTVWEPLPPMLGLFLNQVLGTTTPDRPQGQVRGRKEPDPVGPRPGSWCHLLSTLQLAECSDSL